MPGAPSGFLGRLSAERPLLTAGVLLLGVATLCVLGVRSGGAAASSDLILQFILSAGAVLCLPMALAAFAPERTGLQLLFFFAVALACALAGALALGLLALPGLAAPPLAVTAAAIGFFAFLAALSPLTRSTLRLSFIAPFAAMAGVAGGIGYFAIENFVATPFSAAAIAIAMMSGVCVGVGVGADFAQHFARGLSVKAAAAAAGHAAIAPSSFAVLAAASFAVVVTLKTNFGAVDWRLLGGAGAAVLFATATALVVATGALALFRPSEQVAVDENRRRHRFAESWRPLRRRLPATAALAGSAIAGVLVIVAGFEAGVPEAFSLAGFLVLVLLASGIAFVSIRTSLLITAILFICTVFAGYIYTIFNMPTPAMPERFAALTLAAIALSQLTVSWRNAGDIWRNARDIAQNAMSDGLRRFAIAYGAGGAATLAVAHAFSWEGGFAAAAYFGIVAGLSLFLAPVMMVALSAQFQRY